MNADCVCGHPPSDHGATQCWAEVRPGWFCACGVLEAANGP